jgi:hypothetical protein
MYRFIKTRCLARGFFHQINPKAGCSQECPCKLIRQGAITPAQDDQVTDIQRALFRYIQPQRARPALFFMRAASLF